MKIGMIGAGSWGLALAGLLIDNGHEVKAWSRNLDEVNEINENESDIINDQKSEISDISETYTEILEQVNKQKKLEINTGDTNRPSTSRVKTPDNSPEIVLEVVLGGHHQLIIQKVINNQIEIMQYGTVD